MTCRSGSRGKLATRLRKKDLSWFSASEVKAVETRARIKYQFHEWSFSWTSSAARPSPSRSVLPAQVFPESECNLDSSFRVWVPLENRVSPSLNYYQRQVAARRLIVATRMGWRCRKSLGSGRAETDQAGPGFVGAFSVARFDRDKAETKDLIPVSITPMTTKQVKVAKINLPFLSTRITSRN